MSEEKSDLFTMPEVLQAMDVETIDGDLSSENMATLNDWYAYIKISNKPKTKGMKSQSDPDLNSGVLGPVVTLTTDCGWVYAYSIPDKKQAACLELSCARFSEFVTFDQFFLNMTHEQKTFRSSVEVVDFLIKQGWDKFTIEEGSPLVSWSVWAYLTVLELPVKGYTPTAFDQLRLERSRKLFEDTRQSIQQKAEAEPTGVTKISIQERDP